MGVTTIFKLLTYSGIWRPVSWSSRCKTVAYNLYSFFVVCIGISFTISQMISSVNVDNVEDFVENTYMLVTAFFGCCKLTNIFIYRKRIIGLMNVLLEEPCATSNAEELEIQTKYDKRIRNNTLQYTAMVQASVVTSICNSLLTNFANDRLTYRAWIPYNYSSRIAFGLTYAHQLTSIVFLSIAHVAVDALFCGLLMQICCQFDILGCRLNRLKTDGRAALQNCARHHNYIFSLARTINRTLNISIFSQFFGGFLVLCLSLFQLLKQDVLSSDFFATTCYLISIMVETFLYCWYGNEVKLKSVDLADTIFQTDWIELNKDAKTILLIVMSRTRSAIQLESAHVMTVNIDFFVILVKSSYSLYNVLQSS
ncbi:odorant receptor 94b isoform X2 [Andrena cerasifolii]|uniref:odorant receptor 94b isoform X2 n=1 Tax=Andrena cerasifolii TaxID=2819439 RepID=UPI004037E900